ncbi:MAG: hypothetical protein IT459_22495 [Planctomycetes bacterium]|nr:hypothetical protein [Planctomycetota bacterium]
MRCILGRARAPLALAVAGVALLTGIAVATVIPRDMSKQLELIEAQKDGAVVYGTIVASHTQKLDDVLRYVPFTVLTVKVEQAIAPANLSNEITVYVPGAGEERLSITPSDDEMRVGESVLMFLRADAGIRTHDAAAYKIDSFAEILRTQKNRKGEVVVLGEGASFAVENNTKLSDLSPQIIDAVAVLKAAQSKSK